MLHLTTELTCAYCKRPFPVCIHAEALPSPAKIFTVLCPCQGVELYLEAGKLRPAETCPPGAVGAVQPDLSQQTPTTQPGDGLYHYRTAKFIVGGVSALLTGVFLICAGEVMAGCGAILAALIIFA